jgi:hypothetical protein
VIKPIAALLSDVDQGPFRVMIIDSIIGKWSSSCWRALRCCACCGAYPWISAYCQHLHITACSRTIAALFRMEFAGRGELSERQQKLGQHLGHLVRLAEEFNIAIVVINQCMADPGEYTDWQRCTAVCFRTVVLLVLLMRSPLVHQLLFISFYPRTH